MKCVIIIQDTIGMNMIDPGQYVKLLPDELVIANRIGELRQENNDRALDAARDDSLSGVEMNQLGVRGEFGFCKLVDIWPPLEYSRLDDGWDCSFRGKNIDVKTLKSPDSPINLNIPITRRNSDPSRTEPPAFYVVMQPTPEPELFIFRGIIDYGTAHKPKYIKPGYDNKDFRCIPGDILKSIPCNRDAIAAGVVMMPH